MQKELTENIYQLVIICSCGAAMLVVALVGIVIRHHHKTMRHQRRLSDAQLAHQQELTHAIILSQENERKRIGQDLHDDVGSALANLRLTIEMFDQNRPSSLPAFTQNCKKLIDGTINQVRHIAHNLSPQGIELYGFIGAVEELCDSFSSTGALDVELRELCENRFNEFDTVTQISLYRVIEELLNNTVKHAGASLATLTFTEDESHIFNIFYSDNGIKQFNPSKDNKGMGLRNIESRLGIIGASYLFNLNRDSGFSIQIQLNS